MKPENVFLLSIIVGIIVGIILALSFINEPEIDCLDEIIPEVCPEIDELCEEDFIRMCEFSCKEIWPKMVDIIQICNDIEICHCDLNE